MLDSILPSFSGTLACWAGFIGVLAAAITFLCLGFRNQWVAFSMAGSLLAGGAVMWASTPAWAQDPGALGAAARELIDQAEARGRSAEEALQGWATQVQERGQEYRQEAETLAATNRQNLHRGMTMLKNDPFFGDAAEIASAQPEEEGALYIAVSLTMPKPALRQLALDANKAGAKVVIRGLVNGSFEQTLVAAKEIFDENSIGGVAIEPQVFRAFGVERVPTFIAAKAPVQPCDQGVDCDSVATPHDRLAGNISLAEALRLLAQGGDQAPDVARAALARLEG